MSSWAAVALLAAAVLLGGWLYRLKAKEATAEKKAETQEDYHNLQNEVEAMPDDQARAELRASMHDTD